MAGVSALPLGTTRLGRVPSWIGFSNATSWIDRFPYRVSFFSSFETAPLTVSETIPDSAKRGAELKGKENQKEPHFCRKINAYYCI
jgi:hypothetical protein